LAEDRVRKVLRSCEKQRAEKVLDIGCGDGAFTMLLKDALQADEVHGIELSNEGVESSRAKGIRCVQLDTDGADLPFGDEAFDFVFCGEIIEHMFDPDHLLDEVHRVLKPTGTAILTTPNLASWRSRIALLLGYQPYSSSVSLVDASLGKFMHKSSPACREHIRLMTTRAFRQLLESHSFHVTSLLGSGADITDYFAKPIAFILSGAERVFSIFPSLSDHVIAVIVRQPDRKS